MFVIYKKGLIYVNLTYIISIGSIVFEICTKMNERQLLGKIFSSNFFLLAVVIYIF